MAQRIDNLIYVGYFFKCRVLK